VGRAESDPMYDLQSRVWRVCTFALCKQVTVHFAFVLTLGAHIASVVCVQTNCMHPTWFVWFERVQLFSTEALKYNNVFGDPNDLLQYVRRSACYRGDIHIRRPIVAPSHVEADEGGACVV